MTSSKYWEIRINSVFGGGKEVQLTEAAFIQGNTQLGLGASSVYPTITARGSYLKSNVDVLNNGKSQNSDQTTCQLPCTIEYSFNQLVSPTGLRLGHGTASKNFPASVTIVYATSTDAGSADWRVTIDSVVGNGNQVQLTEIALLDKDTPLQTKNGLSATPRIAPKGLTALTNKSPQSKDQTNCDPLPCTYSFTFDKAVRPTALRMAHADSPKRFPSHVTISYKFNGKWQTLSQFKTAAPPNQKLTDWYSPTASLWHR